MIWIRPLITYWMASLVVLLPLTQGAFSPFVTMVLYGLAVIILLSHISDGILPDYKDDHLAWLLCHGQNLTSHFLKRQITLLMGVVIPVSLSFMAIHLFAYSLYTSLILSCSFILTGVSILCWGGVLALAQGRQSNSILGMVLAPLFIPNLLIADALVAALASSGQPEYYLSMQFGLALVSMGASACLVPLVTQNMDW